MRGRQQKIFVKFVEMLKKDNITTLKEVTISVTEM